MKPCSLTNICLPLVRPKTIYGGTIEWNAGPAADVCSAKEGI